MAAIRISMRMWMDAVLKFYPQKCPCGGEIKFVWIGEDSNPDLVYYECSNPNCNKEFQLCLRFIPVEIPDEEVERG